MINIIVAVAKYNVIGKENGLPWKLPSDILNFKRTTNGHSVLMGRKTWESLPKKFRPLPNRKNIILTTDKDFVAKGAIIRHDLEKVIHDYQNNNQELFIIGGSEIYKQAFKYADRLFLTEIYQDVDGDAYLEGLYMKDWELVEADEKITENGFDFKISLYKRRK